MEPPYPIVLVDDAVEVRSLVRRQLQRSPHFEVVGEGASGPEAVELAARLQPAVLVLDVSMPGGDGLRALPAIAAASPATAVVVLSGVASPQLQQAARAAGAAAWLEKSISPRELPAQLLQVARGRRDPGGHPTTTTTAAATTATAATATAATTTTTTTTTTTDRKARALWA